MPALKRSCNRRATLPLLLAGAFLLPLSALHPVEADAQAAPPAAPGPPAPKPGASPPPAPKAAVGMGDPEAAGEYVLGADDVIELSVSNHADLNRQMTILPDGKITLPDVGDFQAAGKTRQTLAREIQTAYEKTLNNASVTIIVREVRSRSVGITGAVRASNNYALKQNWRLMDLIAAAAGGLTAKPNRVRGRILRRLKNITLDVERANAHPEDPGANVLLDVGDIVLLDELTPLRDEVSVMGMVNRVGAYPFDDQTTILTLITQAGGTNERAALSKAYVRRGKAQMPLNLRPALALNQSDDKVVNFKLEPGDVVVIPEIENRYAVMGQVNRPSYYPIPEKGPVNVFEAFNFAGGQTANADLSKAGIIRMVDGKPTVIPVNMNNVLKKPATALELTLQPEDILFVPPHGARGFVWQDVLSPLTTLSFFGLRLFR